MIKEVVFLKTMKHNDIEFIKNNVYHSVGEDNENIFIQEPSNDHSIVVMPKTYLNVYLKYV